MTVKERLPRPDPLADEDEADPDGFAHRVKLRGYLIARYPVTVSQWRAFYNAYDPQGGQPWTRRPDGAALEALDPRSLDGQATRPVTFVSWYDALAYGVWLTSRLRVDARQRVAWTQTNSGARLATLVLRGDGSKPGRPWGVTLPSEAEWEKAARGPATAWRRPWGDEADANRANGAWHGWTTALQATNAVGSYPGGASPRPLGAEVEELIGNVLEWTRSAWPNANPYEPDQAEKHEDVRAAGEPPRVVRGGSFSGSPEFLRSAYRNFDHPTGRYSSVGFRVVAPFAFDPLASDPSGH